LLVREADKLEDEEHVFIEHLIETSSEIAEARLLAQEFNRILKHRDREAFPNWMERASQSQIPEMKSLASGLERDRAAVVAALTYRWSNGPTEGHINRLKTLKRAMYGRAKLDLLKIRTLAYTTMGADLKQ
jgi:transposase